MKTEGTHLKGEKPSFSSECGNFRHRVKNRRERPLLAFFGHHKCASKWIVRILCQICDYLGLKCKTVSQPSLYRYDIQKFVEDDPIDCLMDMNADYEYLNRLENYVGFHVIRDPRDICVSSYYSHMLSHPTDQWRKLEEHRKLLQSVSKDEGLLLEFECLRYPMECLRKWPYTLPNVLELKMEHNDQRCC